MPFETVDALIEYASNLSSNQALFAAKTYGAIRFGKVVTGPTTNGHGSIRRRCVSDLALMDSGNIDAVVYVQASHTAVRFLVHDFFPLHDLRVCPFLIDVFCSWNGTIRSHPVSLLCQPIDFQLAPRPRSRSRSRLAATTTTAAAVAKRSRPPEPVAEPVAEQVADPVADPVAAKRPRSGVFFLPPRPEPMRAPVTVDDRGRMARHMFSTYVKWKLGKDKAQPIRECFKHARLFAGLIEVCGGKDELKDGMYRDQKIGTCIVAYLASRLYNAEAETYNAKLETLPADADRPISCDLEWEPTSDDVLAVYAEVIEAKAEEAEEAEEAEAKRAAEAAEVVAMEKRTTATRMTTRSTVLTWSEIAEKRAAAAALAAAAPFETAGAAAAAAAAAETQAAAAAADEEAARKAREEEEARDADNAAAALFMIHLCHDHDKNRQLQVEIEIENECLRKENDRLRKENECLRAFTSDRRERCGCSDSLPRRRANFSPWLQFWSASMGWCSADWTVGTSR